MVDGGKPGEATVLVGIMHLAKGLEFRMVVLMACDEVLATERQLFYVAATRARDRLAISAVAPGSDLLEDLSGSC